MTVKPTIPPSLGVNQQFLTTDWNNQVVAQGNWTNEMILGTNGIATISPNALAALPHGGANLITNSNFAIWQRGTSFPAIGSTAVTADAWLSQNVAVSQDNTNQESGSYCLKAAALSGNGYVYQLIFVPQGGGLTATFSARVKSTAPVQVYIFDGVKDILGAATTGSGNYETASCTGTIANIYAGGVVPIQALISTVGTATGDVYIDNAMFTFTPAPIPYFPTHPAEEWRRCQSRYAVMYVSLSLNATAANQYRETAVNFPQPMIVTPVMGGVGQTGGTSGNLAVVGIITGTPDKRHIDLAIVSLGAGYTYVRDLILSIDTGY